MDVDHQSDLALLFDTRLLRIACDLGLEVKNYSPRPSLAYLVGDGEVVVEGGPNPKCWDGMEDYIQSRLHLQKLATASAI